LNKTKILISALVLALGGAALFGGSNVYAEGVTGNTIVSKIASKFGLKESDVQAVFDQNRQEHQAQMQIKFEEQLSQKVKDGKITETQKQLILAKHKEFQANRQSTMDSMKNLTPEQRKTEMEKERTELQTWAKNNGIDEQYLMGGRGGFGGPKGGGMRGGEQPQ
jgi:hypothetical protein